MATQLTATLPSAGPRRAGGLCHDPRRRLSGVTWFPPLPALTLRQIVSERPALFLAQGPKVRSTLRWRELDSNLQFRARQAAISRFRPSWAQSTFGAPVLSEQPSASANDRAVAAARGVASQLRTKVRTLMRGGEGIAELNFRIHSAPAESPSRTISSSMTLDPTHHRATKAVASVASAKFGRSKSLSARVI